MHNGENREFTRSMSTYYTYQDAMDHSPLNSIKGEPREKPKFLHKIRESWQDQPLNSPYRYAMHLWIPERHCYQLFKRERN